MLEQQRHARPVTAVAGPHERRPAALVLELEIHAASSERGAQRGARVHEPVGDARLEVRGGRGGRTGCRLRLRCPLLRCFTLGTLLLLNLRLQQSELFDRQSVVSMMPLPQLHISIHYYSKHFVRDKGHYQSVHQQNLYFQFVVIYNPMTRQ